MPEALAMLDSPDAKRMCSAAVALIDASGIAAARPELLEREPWLALAHNTPRIDGRHIEGADREEPTTGVVYAPKLVS